ncbi:MAG: hypothetical protein DCC67_14715 [Planctomycetota bacterium]|nr:MAG: hypothetical protein DCC67_14715 [Planctomycetota bacterium]
MLRPACKTAVALTALVALGCLAVSPAAAALINLTPATGSPNSVNSVTLSSLLGSSDGIVVGDKIFTGFSYSRTGDMPLPDNVNVLGFRDPDGNWGVTFHGSFIDLPSGAASDAFIRFMVEVDAASQAAGWRISDAHLFMSGAGVGPNSFFAVDESFLGRNETLNTYISTLSGPQQAQLHDSVVFDPRTNKLTVTKDIFALASNGGFLPARATVIDQSFSQERIPEPAAMALATICAMGVVATARRRSSR